MMKSNKSKNKISLIVSVLNEEQTIELLLDAIVSQTLQPDQVIIVDGGSRDQTVRLAKSYSKQIAHLTVKTLPNSSRAVARNWAIAHASYDLIAITDAGCIPQPTWLAKLFQRYQETHASIVGGYFYGLPETPLQQAIVAYTLPTPNRMQEQTFVPATRSVLLTKQAWQEAGKFNETLTTSEDFILFYRAKAIGISIALAKEALVAWLPRKKLSEFSQMIFEFAEGDIVAGVVRPKVQLLFGRYFLVTAAISWMILVRKTTMIQLIPILGLWLTIYLGWAIWKNWKYAPEGRHWLPILQLIADVMIMTGSVSGMIKRYHYQPKLIKNNL
jgi:glycosyltransferase involved in cell wall biosynthesis